MEVVTKRPYRVPTTYAHVDVSLSEFSREEIEGYLAHLKNEEKPNPEDALVISVEDLDRITTLVLCGQREVAREWVCGLISERIGRQL